MDQSVKTSLIQKVKEAVDAGFDSDEGAVLVGIYPHGYRTLVKLIGISRVHENAEVKAMARDLIDQIEKQNRVGNLLTTLEKFISNYEPPQPRILFQKRRKSEKGWRYLRDRERTRFLKLLEDLDKIREDDKSEIKRIAACLSSNNLKVTTEDHIKIRNFFRTYSPNDRPHGPRGPKGWRKVSGPRESIVTRLEAMRDRDDVSLADKKAVAKILRSVKNDRMEISDFHEAQNLITSNRASKQERDRRAALANTFENAVFMACEACNNLGEMKAPALSESVRAGLISKLNSSAAALLVTQRGLIEDNEDEQD